MAQCLLLHLLMRMQKEMALAVVDQLPLVAFVDTRLWWFALFYLPVL
jgi:hypothetical protein